MNSWTIALGVEFVLAPISLAVLGARFGRGQWRWTLYGIALIAIAAGTLLYIGRLAVGSHVLLPDGTWGSAWRDPWQLPPALAFAGVPVWAVVYRATKRSDVAPAVTLRDLLRTALLSMVIALPFSLFVALATCHGTCS